MYIWFSIIITSMLTMVASYYAILETDKKLPIEQRYRSNKYWITLPIIIIVIGSILTYIVAINVISSIALARLMITYIFVAMAGIHDFKLRTIPNIISLSLVIISLILFIIEFVLDKNTFLFLLSSIVGSLAIFLFLYIATKLNKGGIGYGDIKLMGAIGFCTGFYAVFATLLFSLVICSVIFLPMLLLKKKELSGHIPFAPFICGGYIITLALSLY